MDKKVEQKEMPFEEMVKTFKVITYAGQEIPLNEKEQKEWEALSKSQRINRAMNIKKSIELGFMKWAQLGEHRFLVNTEKGKKANEKMEKAMKDMAARQKFQQTMKKNRNLRMQVMKNQATKKASEAPKMKNINQLSTLDKKKIRQKLKVWKARLYKLKYPKTQEELEEKTVLEDKYNRLKGWLQPKMVPVD